MIFISGYFLLIELLDRTLRDPDRSKRLTGLSVIRAFGREDKEEERFNGANKELTKQPCSPTAL